MKVVTNNTRCWEIINETSNRNKIKQTISSIKDRQKYANEIANLFNNYFIAVAINMSNKNKDYKQIESQQSLHITNNNNTTLNTFDNFNIITESTIHKTLYH